jgi:hypothetical protein
MPRTKTLKDVSLLNAALEGLEAQKQKIEQQIQAVQSMLGRRRGRPAAAGHAKPEKQPPKRRRLSAAARKRIALAQKRRWAEYHRQTAGAA